MHQVDIPKTDDQASLAAGRRNAPSRLVLVRHGQSVGNIAAEQAHDAGLGQLVLDTRDPDTPLSDNGVRQAEALGDYLKRMPEDERPDVVLSSPYVRARGTAEAALKRAGLDHALVVDERLRERDLGILDGYTSQGIRERFPDEAERRQRVGKFYYRPTGGESWCDVALRVRSVLGDIRAEYGDAQVWVFSHQAVIMAFRLVLESLDEKALLEVDQNAPMANCSLTSYRRDDHGSLRLEDYAVTTHIEDSAQADETHEASAAEEPA